MKQTLIAIINILRFRYRCDCGYKTNSLLKIKIHLKNHESVCGSIDCISGKVVW